MQSNSLPFPTAEDELQNLLSLLKTEKEEDLRIYNEYIRNAGMQERRKRGVCWFPLIIKETGYGLGDYPYVIVERTGNKNIEHQFSGGKMASLFTQQAGLADEEAAGTIHFVTGDTIKIILSGDELPDWLDGGKIGINLLFDERSYREMELGVKAAMKAENNRLAELRDILLGFRQPKSKKLDELVNIPSLNASQNEAVNAILAAEDVAVMHGPPGTGKTTTLVQAISQLSRTEKKILVCAPSNAAADLLTERLAAAGLNVVRIGNLSRIDESITSHTLEGLMAGHSLTQDIKRLRKSEVEYRRMANKYKRHFGKAEREQRKLLIHEAKQISKDIQSMENYLVGDILDKAQAVIATLVGSVNRYIEGMKFDTLVIDEAAQALEPASWIPIGKAQKVVLAGDPFQLPPTVKSMEASKKGLSVTLIEKCLQRLPEVHLLDTQYRMNETIMNFSNREFYNGALKAAESVRFATLNIPESQALEFIDTAGASFDEKMNPESQSLFNEGEADILRKHLLTLIAQLSYAGEKADIGIISPYREQVVYMRERFLQDPEIMTGQDVTINTIDSFQGQERDVIYISLVRSNDRSEIGFLKDYRRMNVAMTRARKKLIIIGDSATLASDPFYVDFLNYAEEKGQYKSAWELME